MLESECSVSASSAVITAKNFAFAFTEIPTYNSNSDQLIEVQTGKKHIWRKCSIPFSLSEQIALTQYISPSEQAPFPKADFSKSKRRGKCGSTRIVTHKFEKNVIAKATEDRNRKIVKTKLIVIRSIFKKIKNAHGNDTDESEISPTLDHESDTDIDDSEDIIGDLWWFRYIERNNQNFLLLELELISLMLKTTKVYFWNDQAKK